MKIGELKPGMDSVDLTAKVTSVSEPREVMIRRTGSTTKLATAEISDDTGTITLVLWGDQVNLISGGEEIEIVNGYTRSFRGQTQVNVGRRGKLTVK